MQAPFFWNGNTGQTLTPGQAKVLREMAAQKVASQGTPSNLGEGLASVGNALLYNSNMSRANEAESAGVDAVKQALAEARASGTPDGFLDVMGNEWATPGQQMIAGELYQRSIPEWQTFEAGGDRYRYNSNASDWTPEQFFDGPDDLAASDENYFSPIKGFDADGNPMFVQPGNKGSSNVMDLPEGFQPQQRFEKVDLGTEWLITDTTTGQQQRLPKDNYGEAFDTAAGGASGKLTAEQMAAAPATIAAGDNALSLIDNVRNDPALESATGFSGVVLNKIPGFDQLGFERKVEQIKSGAFLTAIKQLQGMGALSNSEGQTATAAVTRLSTALSKDDFLEALGEYELIVKQGQERARKQMGGATGAPTGAPTDDIDGILSGLGI